MLGISSLWAELSTQAVNVQALAQTVDGVNEGLRTRLYLDHAEDAPVQVLDHQAAGEPAPTAGSSNGRRSRKATATSER